MSRVCAHANRSYPFAGQIKRGSPLRVSYKKKGNAGIGRGSRSDNWFVITGTRHRPTLRIVNLVGKGIVNPHPRIENRE